MEKQTFLIWGLKEEEGIGVGKVRARFPKWTENFKSSPDKWQSSSMCKGRAVVQKSKRLKLAKPGNELLG